MIDSRRHSVQKQLVLINDLYQVAGIAGLTTEVGLVWGVLIKLRTSCLASYKQNLKFKIKVGQGLSFNVGSWQSTKGHLNDSFSVC